MKKLLQIDPNYVPTTSQKLASALRGSLVSVYEMRPEYVDNPALKIFDRARGLWRQTSSTAKIGVAGWTSVAKGSGFIFSNDGRDTHSYPHTLSQGNKFTLIAVGQQSATGITYILQPSSSAPDASTAIMPSLMITSTGILRVYEGRTERPERLSATIPAPAGVHIYAMTFSTTEGLKLFVDGTQVAAAPNDKRPYTSLDVSVTMAGTGGYGHVLLIEDDMSTTDNQAAFQLARDALKAHYNLV